MSDPTETVRQTILAQLEPIREREEQLTAELQAVSAMRMQLTEALAAMKPPKVRRSSGKKTKPCCTKAQVAALCQKLVGERVVARNALETEVKRRLKAEGQSLAGFSLRFAEVLNDDVFTVTPDGRVTTKAKQKPVDNQARGATDALMTPGESGQN